MPKTPGLPPGFIGPAMLAAIVHRRLHEGLLEAAYIFQRKIQVTLSQRGTGRIYYRRGRAHRASAPGEPPAVDTSRLRGSVRVVDRTVPGVRISIRVGTSVNYAAILERGRRGMAKRPFMRPAYEAARPAMTRAVVAAGRDLKFSTKVVGGMIGNLGNLG